MDNENENKNPVPEVSWEEDQEDQKKEPQKYTFWQWLFMSKKKGKKAGLSKKTLILLDIKEWIFSLLFAFVAVYLIITFGVRVITVEGTSMNPTLADGERLFVTAYDVRFGSAPERGDVVICHYPGRTSKWPSESIPIFTVKTDFVKRVVGVPGDTVSRVDGITYINDKALTARRDPSEGLIGLRYEKNEDGSLSYYRKSTGEQVVLSDQETYRYAFDYTYTLGEDEYFVVGDNRYASHDSRFWNGPDMPYQETNDASGDVGPVSKSLIIGHVRSVVLPLKQRRGVENDAEYTYPGDLTHE